MEDRKHLNLVSTTGFPLRPGGGGGNNGDMDARLTALEDIAKDTRSSLESIQRQLARMDERMNHMPKTRDVYTIVFAVYGLSFTAIAAAAGFFALIK